MQTQQYKHWYFYLLNVTASLVYELLIPFFRPYFPNYFHCFLSIMLRYFNLFIPVVPNWNIPTSLWSTREITYWYQTYFWHYCKTSFNSSGFTGHILSSVPSCCIYQIYVQKLQSIVGCLMQSLLCQMYHRKRYHRKQYTPILLHGDSTRLFHIHLFQVP